MSMFKVQMSRVRRRLFVSSVEDKIKGLEHMDFGEDAVASFKTAMKMEAATLADKGDRRFDKTAVSLHFLTPSVAIDAECADDIWVYMFSASKKAAAINAGLAPMTPWEPLLFEQGEVPVAPRWVTIPEDELTPIIEVRQTINEACGSDPPPSTG